MSISSWRTAAGTDIASLPVNRCPVESAVYDLPCDTKQKIKALRAQLAQSNGYAAGEAAAADAADGALQGAAQSSEAKLLTLSTCANDSRDDVRFAVHCVLEEMGKY